MSILKQERVSTKVNGNKLDPRSGFGIDYVEIPKTEYHGAVEVLQSTIKQSTIAKRYEILIYETAEHYTIELRMSKVPVIQTMANKQMAGYKEHCAKHFLTMICIKGINQITH